MQALTYIKMIFVKIFEFIVQSFLSPDDLVRGAIGKIRNHEEALRHQLANVMVQFESNTKKLESLKKNLSHFEFEIKKHINGGNDLETRRAAAQIQSIKQNILILERAIESLRATETKLNDEILNCSIQIQTLENKRAEIQSGMMVSSVTGGRLRKSDYRKLVDQANERINLAHARDSVDEKFDSMENAAEKAEVASSIDNIIEQYKNS